MSCPWLVSSMRSTICTPCTTNNCRFTVIDEADELLSTGWEEVIDSLFGAGSDTNVDADHTYLMFSATFSKEARKLCREHMEEDFVRIKVGRIGSTHSNIQQEIIYVSKLLIG